MPNSREVAAAMQAELAYALNAQECTSHQVRLAAKRAGLGPGIWFRLAIILGALLMKATALASGQPATQDFNVAGETWELTLQRKASA